MISDGSNKDELPNLISKTNSIAICLSPLHSIPIIEIIGAGLSLALTKDGREIIFSAPKETKLNYPHKEKLDRSQGNRDLIISLPYNQEDIEKITTLAGPNGEMEIAVQTRKGLKPIRAEEIKTSYRGLDVQLIVLVGIRNLTELAETYSQNQLLFQEVPLVHFYYPNTTPLGKYNFPLTPGAEVENIVEWLREEKMEINPLGADLLLWGLRYQKNNFQKPLSLATAQAVSWLLEKGGSDQPLTSPSVSKPILTTPPRIAGL